MWLHVLRTRQPLPPIATRPPPYTSSQDNRGSTIGGLTIPMSNFSVQGLHVLYTVAIESLTTSKKRVTIAITVPQSLLPLTNSLISMREDSMHVGGIQWQMHYTHRSVYNGSIHACMEGVCTAQLCPHACSILYIVSMCRTHTARHLDPKR